MVVDPKEVASPAAAEPFQPAYGGLGPPTLPRYREPARPPTSFVTPDTSCEEVVWRQGSKDLVASRFAVVEVRPSCKEACRTAQEQAGGRNRWDGVLPLKMLLVEQPEESDWPTGYWMTDLPATTPSPTRPAGRRCAGASNTTTASSTTASLDHFEGRTWRGWHHHVTLVTAAQASLTLRRLDPRAMPA
ncbi:hypothetical protein AB0E74_27780 [Streptomyces sp. NPDC030392]|uniref:hypothetical protein n=1 Tax=Streptomyces sp. NPDC030392 TaxID=3155468 RepID=UPI0033DC0C1A